MKLLKVYAANRTDGQAERTAKSMQAATYRDYNGIMGDPGGTWTTEDLKAYWKANHISDPVLRAYDSMQGWLNDTIAMLHPVTYRFVQVKGSEDYYDYPKYSKTLYLPSIRQGKVKLTIGTFTDPRYDDDNTFEILAIVEVESRRYEFTLDSGKLYRKLDIRDGHEKLSGYDDRYDNIEDTVDEIYEYFMTLDQNDIDDTLIELADDFDVDRVNQMFGPMTTL